MHYNYLKTFKTAFLIAFVLFILGNRVSAQTAATTTAAPAAAAPTGAVTFIDKFFKSYDKLGTTRAVIDLFKTNVHMDSTHLIGMIIKIDSMRNIIGKYMGKELIMQRKASNSLILYSYLVKHEAQPARFTFVFYKPKNEWEIYRFNFDLDVDGELMDAAKVTGKP